MISEDCPPHVLHLPTFSTLHNTRAHHHNLPQLPLDTANIPSALPSTAPRGCHARIIPTCPEQWQRGWASLDTLNLSCQWQVSCDCPTCTRCNEARMSQYRPEDMLITTIRNDSTVLPSMSPVRLREQATQATGLLPFLPSLATRAPSLTHCCVNTRGTQLTSLSQEQQLLCKHDLRDQSCTGEQSAKMFPCLPGPSSLGELSQDPKGSVLAVKTAQSQRLHRAGFSPETHSQCWGKIKSKTIM